MDEREFLKTLQNRATEQEDIIHGMIFPRVFAAVSFWLGVHPWRILIPIAFILSLLFHFMLGHWYDTLILKIFGGFGFIKIR